jgi:hypothetical protein
MHNFASRPSPPLLLIGKNEHRLNEKLEINQQKQITFVSNLLNESPQGVCRLETPCHDLSKPPTLAVENLLTF